MTNEVPTSVIELVERYDRNIDSYRNQSYNEAQVRKEFIDPFFEALGWDVANKSGYAEAYKDVIHEDAIKVGGVTKAPDYCFRIGPVRKFFLEAKKPSVSIKDGVAPAYQLRRYAWSAKLPVSILTDFEEFAVYDCRVRPKLGDSPGVARIQFTTYQDYPERWPEIASVFSKEAVLQGSFDKYAVLDRGKRGTSEVDAEFLKEIETWRDALARNLAVRNPGLSIRELNFAVQRTIDRIVFLRMCEDRGIETYGSLQALLNGATIYDRLLSLYRSADDRYNSGLFHFQVEKGRAESPDALTPSLSIDDKTLKDIIRRLYYPESPYEFSMLGADILGSVYEQFLGKVIRLTAGHRAVVEEKPEVKKAGGVYYTPAYIVDYMVQNTVGKLCDGKTPRQIGRLRILDPACGSGSFLIGAYEYLLRYHRDWYVDDGPAKHSKEIYQGAGGQWHLATQEKRRILLTNIYGVDIDSQAVEVTKLNLLLKVLEDENQESINQTMKMWHERALPDLGNNVKCGNSLIGPDYFQDRLIPDEDEMLRVNPFDWDSEFADIMRGGGFDAVIGNPPYVFTRNQLSKEERDYFASSYKASWEKHNTFMLFMEMMLRLLGSSGRGAFIVPNSWLTIESGKLLRAATVEHIELIADLNYQVFNRVSMEPSIFVLSLQKASPTVEVFRAYSEEQFHLPNVYRLRRSEWKTGGGRFTFSDDPQTDQLLTRLSSTQQIGNYFEVRSGLQAYEEGRGVPPQTARNVKEHIFDRSNPEDDNSIRYLRGKDVSRYSLVWSGQWMQYGPWLAQPRELDIFSRPRILLREITDSLPYCLLACYADEVYLNNKSVLNIMHESDDGGLLKFLLGILNSRLLSLYYKSQAVKGARRVFPKVVIKNVREFPLPMLSAGSFVQGICFLVDQMQTLQNQLTAATTPAVKTAIRRRMEATDKQIDQLVYALYGLTEEEIRIVEAAG